MARVHKSYRLDADLVGRIEAWAREHEVTQAEAVSQLVTAALDGRGGDAGEAVEGAAQTASVELRRLYGEHIRDLRATVSTLTAQVAEKDRQIGRLQDIAEHSQVLEAAHVAGTLVGTVDDTQAEGQPRGVWAWLARKIDGR